VRVWVAILDPADANTNSLQQRTVGRGGVSPGPTGAPLKLAGKIFLRSCRFGSMPSVIMSKATCEPRNPLPILTVAVGYTLGYQMRSGIALHKQ
jgi:hypothetical protein